MHFTSHMETNDSLTGLPCLRRGHLCKMWRYTFVLVESRKSYGPFKHCYTQSFIKCYRHQGLGRNPRTHCMAKGKQRACCRFGNTSCKRLLEVIRKIDSVWD